MRWNKRPDKTPIPRCLKGTPLAVAAAMARIKELGGAAAISGRRKPKRLKFDELPEAIISTRNEPSERAERLCAPSDAVEAAWRKKHPVSIEVAPAAVLGDPAPSRAASSGTAPIGWLNPAGLKDGMHRQPWTPRFRQPSKPQPFRGWPFIFAKTRGAVKTAAVVSAVLGAKGCRYPEGDPKEDDFRFCGAPLKAGTSWCEIHFKVCSGGRWGFR